MNKRGVFVRDAATGTQLQIGSVGYELAATFAEQGNRRLAEETLGKPLVGLWFSKTF